MCVGLFDGGVVVSLCCERSVDSVFFEGWFVDQFLFCVPVGVMAIECVYLWMVL